MCKRKFMESKVFKVTVLHRCVHMQSDDNGGDYEIRFDLKSDKRFNRPDRG